MSYILDALKKSEREHTLVRGVGFGDAGRRVPRDHGWLFWLTGGLVAAAGVAATVFVLHERAAVEKLPETTPSTMNETRDTATTNISVGTAASAKTAMTPPPLQEVAVQAAPKPVLLLPAQGEAKLLSTMPLEFQQRVPLMTVNIHVYAEDESQRILYINNRQYFRGDEIPGGVVVEEIVPEGVVLQYQGRRFRLPRPS